MPEAVEEPTKVCTRCEQPKPLSRFRADPRYKDGHVNQCKPCNNKRSHSLKRANNLERLREVNRAASARYHRKPEFKLADRKRKLRCYYGMEWEDYVRMEQEQGGKCKICQQPPPEGTILYVDHCHTTDKVRGLLCRPCNTAVGFLKDNPALALATAKYLEENK